MQKQAEPTGDLADPKLVHRPPDHALVIDLFGAVFG
jgi:hypothetical protein